MSSKPDFSERAQPAHSTEPLRPPPQCVPGRLGGKQAVAPTYPLRAPGPERAELKVSFGESDQSDWRDVAFVMGRAPFDSKFCAAHAQFVSFAPTARGLEPVYRHLIFSRAAAP